MIKEYHLSTNPVPEGFRIYLNYLPIMGLAKRKGDAAKFCKGSGRELTLEPEPGNTHDPNAIKVVGSWKGWFGRKARHLGYVPAEHAAKLVALGLSRQIRARLLKTYLGADGFVEIEFQIIGPKKSYEQFQPRRPATPADAETNKAALPRVDALTTFLAEAPRLSKREAERLRKSSFSQAFGAMLDEGKTFGEASGGPAFLNQPEADVRSHLHSIDNDLTAQVEIVDTSCRSYFKTGETPAPYYPWRIAVILSKMREKDRERDFLSAWCRHFPDDGGGGRYADLVKRAKKLGGRSDHD